MPLKILSIGPSVFTHKHQNHFLWNHLLIHLGYIQTENTHSIEGCLEGGTKQILQSVVLSLLISIISSSSSFWMSFVVAVQFNSNNSSKRKEKKWLNQVFAINETYHYCILCLVSTIENGTMFSLYVNNIFNQTHQLIFSWTHLSLTERNGQTTNSSWYF